MESSSRVGRRYSLGNLLDIPQEEYRGLYGITSSHLHRRSDDLCMPDDRDLFMPPQFIINT